MASERSILAVVAAAQFVNVLDFMMVTPLGPDYAAQLGIPLHELGFVGGSYTAAGAIAGLVGSTLFDRFDRRKGLAVALLGLGVGTLAGGLATSAATLYASRVVAGAFGGPATAMANAIIADVVPVERRGRAMGVVMGAFSVASVLGVPAGLELARLGSWRTPFTVVGGIALLLAVAAAIGLPPLRAHLDRAAPTVPLGAILARREVRITLAVAALMNFSGFVLVPNFPSFVQYNMGFPREGLGSLYLVGGVATFFALRVYGRIIDRVGSFPVVLVATVALATVTAVWFLGLGFGLPVMVLFVAFMLSMSARNAGFSTLMSKVPKPDERARYMSLQSSVQHTFSAVGAFAGAALLTEGPGHTLVGVGPPVVMSICAMVGVPLLVARVER